LGAIVVLELGIETGGVQEEEDRGERRFLRHASSDTVRQCRLAIEVKTGRAIQEATDPPDHPEGESLELESVEEARVVYCIKSPFNIQLQ
jgi:hypothetical protein